MDRKVRLLITVALLLFLNTAIALATLNYVQTQASDVPTLSYEAFKELSALYDSGGSAPVLVSQLNYALTLMEEANAKRAGGDASAASSLDDQARSIIDELTPKIAAAQQETIYDSKVNAQTKYGATVLVICVLTIAAYSALRFHRYAQDEKLYGMRIL